MPYGINFNLFFARANGWSLNTSQLDDPSNTVIVADSRDMTYSTGDDDNVAAYGHEFICLPGGNWYTVSRVAARHLDTVNTLFLDGHVKAMRRTELEKIVPNPGREVSFISGLGYMSSAPTTYFRYFQTAADPAYAGQWY